MYLFQYKVHRLFVWTSTTGFTEFFKLYFHNTYQIPQFSQITAVQKVRLSKR